MPSRKRLEEEEITARPKSIDEELAHLSTSERGLSVDPEDLGARFLTEAIEADTSDEDRNEGASDLSITGGAPSDAALTGPTFDPDNSVWEQTIDLTLQNDGRTELPLSPRDGQRITRAAEESDVDLTGSEIAEGSLLDHEGASLGDVESPVVETDEFARTGRRAKPGGRKI